MENQQTPEGKTLAQIFKNNSNCYADTREENHDTVPPTLVDGPVVMAMTEDVFVTVVSDINSHHQEANAELQEKIKDLEDQNFETRISSGQIIARNLSLTEANEKLVEAVSEIEKNLTEYANGAFGFDSDSRVQEEAFISGVTDFAYRIKQLLQTYETK